MCIGSAILTIDYVVKSECPEASGPSAQMQAA